MNATGIPHRSVASPRAREANRPAGFARSFHSAATATLSPAALPRGTPLGKTAQRRILIATQLAHSAFLQGITRYAREHKWQLITDMLHTGALPQRWDGDGILAFVPYQSDITAYVAGTDMPCVTVSMTDDCSALPRIQPDNVAIGRLAAEHLLHRNCRHFLWAPFIDDRQNEDRFRGFHSEIQRHGCSCRVLPPAHRKAGGIWQDDWPSWRQSVAEQLSRCPERAGLFAFNDCLSAEIAALAHELGLSVPRDLAVLGVGNEAIECESASVKLSSVDPNLEEMAYQAARLLAQILDGKQPRDGVLTVPPRSIDIRESTAISNVSYPRFEQALVYIAERYADPNLSVGSVADALGISRRQLERDFRSENGYTAREYIERARMQEAARLLLEQPNATVAEIAEQVGISAPGNFFRIFRKRFGTTPAAFRAQAGESQRKSQ